MAKKVLALNTEGKITFCTVEPENRGKGRCNHVAHQNPGESASDFIARINEKQEELTLEKDVDEEKVLAEHEEISQKDIDSIAEQIDSIAGEKLDLDNYKRILNKLGPDEMNKIISLAFDAAPRFSLPITDDQYEDEEAKNRLYFANLPDYGLGKSSAFTQMFEKVGDVPALHGTDHIEHNYAEGLTPEEYFKVQFGARDASINKSVSTAKPGYCIWENSKVEVRDRDKDEASLSMKQILWSELHVGDEFTDGSIVEEIQPWQYKKCYELKIENSEPIVLSYDHLLFGEIYVGNKLVDNLEASEKYREIIGESDSKWICVEDIYNFHETGADIKISVDGKDIDYIQLFKNGESVKVRCISTDTGFYQTNNLVHHNTARKLFYAMSDTIVVEDCGGPYIDAMHCNLPEGHVCEKCAHLTEGGERIKQGMLVGGWISTNISEALTQLSMKQKHVGGTQILAQLNTSKIIMSTLDGWSTSPIIQKMQEAKTTEEMRDILYNGLKEAYASANIAQDEFNIQMVARKLTSYKRENGYLRPINPGEKADIVSMGTLGNNNNVFKVSELTSGYNHLTRPTKQHLGKDAANQILR